MAAEVKDWAPAERIGDELIPPMRGALVPVEVLAPLLRLAGDLDGVGAAPNVHLEVGKRWWARCPHGSWDGPARGTCLRHSVLVQVRDAVTCQCFDRISLRYDGPCELLRAAEAIFEATDE